MPIELVTLDCAQTLIEVNWSLPRMVAISGAELGLSVDSAGADRYEALFQSRISDYFAINRANDTVASRAFFVDLSKVWLAELGHPANLAEELVATSEAHLHRQDGVFYRLYDDVCESLATIRAAGIRLAVISNWDLSLERTLRTFELYDSFDLVLASLVEGVEKPDKRLFNLCLDRLKVRPENALHIGDDPVDDLAGGNGAGMHAALIDRALPAELPHRISTLNQILELVQWIG